MSRNQKTILILFVVLFAILFVVEFSKAPAPAPVTPAKAGTHFTGVAYLPLVVVNRGEAEVVVVVDEPSAKLVRVERPVQIEKPVTDPCDSRNDPEGNPDPHPCPQRHSGQAEEQHAPWPTPEPSPTQPKHQQQQSQPTGGKRGG